MSMLSSLWYLIYLKQFAFEDKRISGFDLATRAGVVPVAKFAGYVNPDLPAHFSLGQATRESLDHPVHGKARRLSAVHRTVENGTVNEGAVVMKPDGLAHGWAITFALS